MYVLDTISFTWYEINCSLAPLPRKGHSLNSFYFNEMGKLNKELNLVIFGGYSIENVTLSNSVFICDANNVMEYYERSKKRLLSDTQSSSAINIPNNIHNLTVYNPEDPDPLVWRTMNCRGTAPSPRYRHSACIVSGNSGESLLVIVGGIGKDPKVALNDVFILDLQNSTWININNGNDSLSRGMGGDGPVTGIYGHISFPIVKSAKNQEDDGQPAYDSNQFFSNSSYPQYEILIFGGSSNPQSMRANCYPHLFAFDITGHRWRKVSTGHTMPSSRTNHSLTLVEGWAPKHDMPFYAGPAGLTNNYNTNLRTCAVVFGGTGAITCAADTWALDLQWRPAGVAQYDNNTNQLITDQIENHMMGHNTFNPTYDTPATHGNGTRRIPQNKTLISKSISATTISSATSMLAHELTHTNPISIHKIHSHNNQKYLSHSASNHSHTPQQQHRRSDDRDAAAQQSPASGNFMVPYPIDTKQTNIPAADETLSRAAPNGQSSGNLTGIELVHIEDTVVSGDDNLVPATAYAMHVYLDQADYLKNNNHSHHPETQHFNSTNILTDLQNKTYRLANITGYNNEELNKRDEDGNEVDISDVILKVCLAAPPDVAPTLCANLPLSLSHSLCSYSYVKKEL
jgi:hypothetical protein